MAFRPTLDRLCPPAVCGLQSKAMPVVARPRARSRRRKTKSPSGSHWRAVRISSCSRRCEPRAFGSLAARFKARFGRELLRVGVLREGSGILWQGPEREDPAGITSRKALGPPRYPLGTQTPGTDPRGAMHAAVVDPDGLEVREPATLRFIHRVADVIPRLRTLAANFAPLSHSRQIVPRLRSCGKLKS